MAHNFTFNFSSKNIKNHADSKNKNPAWLHAQILKGDRFALAKAITLIESSLETDRILANQLIGRCLDQGTKSIRIGISGPPGVGKSTFIDSFGMALLEKGKKVAVLTIDPSSSLKKGSILGDKTRMENLSQQTNAFIRPSANTLSLGGVAQYTQETIWLCEAAGYDTIIVETVGVGQSEIEVHQMVDTMLLLLPPVGGDDLQGIKRGIMEMAQIICINKTDGSTKDAAIQTKNLLAQIIPMFSNNNQWKTKLLNISALEKTGIPELLGQLETFKATMVANNWLITNRMKQKKYWFQKNLEQAIFQTIFNQKEVKTNMEKYVSEIEQDKISPFEAIQNILDSFRNKKSGNEV